MFLKKYYDPAKLIWDRDINAMPRWKSMFIKQVRLFIFSVTGFKKDYGLLRASALTFFVMLSVVPVVAMIFAVARGFGLETMLQEQLFKALAGHEEVAERILAFAENSLSNAKSGVIAGVGVVVLLWSVMQVLGNIEESFNAVWKVKRGRSLVRKFTDYFAIILTSPILLIVASGTTIFVTSQIEKISKEVELIGSVTPFIFSLLKFLPYLLYWILFMLIYMIMPNTRVKPGVALISGIIFGTLFQLVEWVYVKFQVGVSSYNAIYGSFAALPLFLVWVQTSWVIVLLGAEYCYAFQNFDPYVRLNQNRSLPAEQRHVIALMITRRAVQNFISNHPAPTLDEIRKELKLEKDFVRSCADDLVECGILARCLPEDKSGNPNRNPEYGYIPAKNPDTLTVETIISALDRAGSQPLSLTVPGDETKLQSALEKIRDSMKKSDGNIPLWNI
ncbi:MAG: YihY/virulence factor BrkB family protein [Bacteroidetes bacterium]|nr:YihY/virulence factor BrkB family protein [Bacteroidota bacterium]